MPVTYYGTDSAATVMQTLPVLKQQWGVLPSWYARYLGNYQITPQEIQILLGSGIRVCLVYNLGGADGTDGAAQAQDAIARMHSLGLHTVIFKDIETNMPTTPQWLEAWSLEMAKFGVPSGFYANCEWQAFDAPYNQIVAGVPRINRLVWSSEPEPGYFPPNAPPPWGPFTPQADPSAVVLWQFTENQFNGLVDLDLATEEAYRLMAGPVPPAPQYPIRAHVRVPGALKVAADHRSPVAIYPNHDPANPLPVGTEVAIDGPAIPDPLTHDGWVPVRLVGPAQVHGFYLEAMLVRG